MNVQRGVFQEIADSAAALDTTGHSEWFTAAELAELALPGLPQDKRSLNRRAREEHWHLRLDPAGEPLARQRAGRGGGTEYHYSLLPAAAQLELARRGIVRTGPVAVPEPAADGSWRWYGLQNAKTKAEAERRMAQLSEIAMLESAALTRTAAVAEVARRYGTGKSTLWSWLDLVEGVARADWLPALAPRRKGGGREAIIDPFLWTVFASDYLRPSEPTLAACYDRVADIAAERGLSIPSQVTFRRRAERELPRAVRILRRKGPEALRRSIPAQRRTVEHLDALEIVNIDGHMFDVRVTPPGGGDPVRPIIVAIQDVMSSKMLAWCIDLSENAIQTQIAFGRLFREYGLPRAVLMDNGRAFASKKISGGAPSRYRFLIKDDEPTGVLVALDINPTWALPYRGQSKPIERAFREVCEQVAKHPAMEGAYTGNSPVNKPHNYGQRAIPWDEFVAHVEREIARSNAKPGRTGRHYARRSFDQVFGDSYAVAPIRKATPEQLHMAMLSAQQRTVSAHNSQVELFGNRYWTPAMHDLAGQRVMVRFDPENLHSEVHLFDRQGRFLMTAPVLLDVGFDSEAGAKAAARRVAEFRRDTRRLVELQQLIDAQEVATLLPGATPAELPEPAVVRPVRHRGQTAAALKTASEPLRLQDERMSRISNALGGLRVVE